MMGLTHNQQKCLDTINDFVNAQGRPPSYREIMDRMDLSSTSAVSRLVLALEERGYINRLRARARAIEIIDHRACPHCGMRP